MSRGPGKSRFARYHYRAQLEQLMKRLSRVTVLMYEGKKAVCIIHTKDSSGLWWAEEEDVT